MDGWVGQPASYSLLEEDVNFLPLTKIEMSTTSNSPILIAYEYLGTEFLSIDQD